MDWRDADLRDDDIELRPWVDGDREAVGTSPRDPIIGRYFGGALGGPPMNTDDLDAPSFAICRAGDPVGRIWFRPGVRPFEVGYYVRPDYWGQGIATRALVLVADWMLRVNSVEAIMLFAHPENLGSQRVAEKARFVRDGSEASYAEFKDGSHAALRFIRRRPPG